MLVDHSSAEELDGSEVVLDLWREANRLKPLAAIFVGDQGTIGLRDRAEEACRSVTDCVPFLRGDIEAVNVRDAGVVGRAVQRPVVRREDEALGRRRRKLEL